ncbi:hypothetical protein GCM10025331_50400 [Actinoplanes utahensis]|uniref:Alpha integrin n=2 Tax=Actinoplanes utahensis TaxID=1869 RepID=A0A0A6UPA4_ACTUT|nr:hypothetical protein MB27_12665 [Actinoplanes utahensis]GIF33482.1 hypothetical protein Aut01nite_64680 [Actinoplanes utahensis]
MLSPAVALMACLPFAVVPPAAHAAPPPPGGRISLATLREATLDVPPWPTDGLRCPSGRLRFRGGEAPVTPKPVPDGRPPYGEFLTVLSAAHGDIDHDGADETVAVLGCLIEGGSKQIVAYDRDASGAIVSRGRVAATTGEVRDIRDTSVRVDGSGRVTARVADYQRCCADRTPQTWQTRGYALRGGRFTQVSGPARMPLNRRVTAIGLTTGDLVLGPATGGYRYGTLAVTATHRRGAHPGQIVLTFTAPDGLRRAGAAWPRVTTGPGTFSVRVTAPAAGRSATYRFAFRQAAAAPAGELALELATVPAMSQAIPWDGYATARIRPAPASR